MARDDAQKAMRMLFGSFWQNSKRGEAISLSLENLAGDGDGCDSADAPAPRGGVGGPEPSVVRPSIFPRRAEPRVLPIPGHPPRLRFRLQHCRLADRPDLAEIHSQDDLATNQVTAMRVRSGERIAALPVAGGEVTLKIHAPQLIRTRDQRERL